MKKLLFVAVIVSVAGYFAWAKVLQPAPKRACDRMVQLCGKADSSDAGSCEEFFDALDKAGGDEPGKTAQCVLDAKNCAEAVGCAAGGAMKIGAGAAKSFIDGLGKALK